MRCLGFFSLICLAFANCARAETTLHTESNQPAQYPDGTVACTSEAAIVALMEASPPYLPTNEKKLDASIKSGDCLIIPDDWEISSQEDPPLDKQMDHGSKWTIRTPHGVIQLWGTPMGGD